VFSPTDTIVAIATAPLPAGIGVVRLSGPRAHGVARAILTVMHDLAPRRATLTRARPALAAGSPEAGSGAAPRSVAGSDGPVGSGGSPPRQGAIDEVVATYFPAPHSYTAEDVVEISAHGSVALLREIVRAAIEAGARLAEPGEFTLRAFLNGRLDLVQAEAVADLVEAVTPLQARLAFDQLEGTLTRAIGVIDRELFDLAAALEASVDFPDEGYHFIGPGEAAMALGRVREGIDALLATSASGRVIREGRHIAILGKPNVGKSSLFNQLVGTDRAIVAAGPGTTRDMLRETIDLDGIRLGLVDTAGIRSSDDEVEQAGVARARGAAGVADLIALVLDRSRPLEEVDRSLLRETAMASRVVVVNKIDLAAEWETTELLGFVRDSGVPALGPAAEATTETAADGPSSRADERQIDELTGGAENLAERRKGFPRDAECVLVSLKTGAGMDDLRAALRAALDVEEPLRDAPMITNVRHERLLRQARESVVRAMENLGQAGESASEELVLADIADARRAIEEVTGRRTSEDILRRIFEKFCIGK
jgi:tRNA modification GTPase